MRRRLSRLLAHRMPPSSAIPRRSAASDALRYLLALSSSPRLAAFPLLSRSAYSEKVPAAGSLGSAMGAIIVCFTAGISVITACVVSTIPAMEHEFMSP